MKVDYSIKINNPVFEIESWLSENHPDTKTSYFKRVDGVYKHYLELIDEFREFLNSTEVVVDSDNQPLKPIDIFNAVEYYKIRISKLLLILNLRLYKTHNVNKDTQVRYIVMRSFWIDDKGKQFRYFSKNLGAENKVLVNGKIPVKVMESVEDYISTLMWDRYYFEYIDNSNVGIDENGNVVIPD